MQRVAYCVFRNDHAVRNLASSLRSMPWQTAILYLPAVLEHLCVALKAENADQILLTGDLVQIGLESEIRQAADWLADLGAASEIMLVPGNHDIYAGGSADIVADLWADYMLQAAGSCEFPVVRKLGKLTLIGLSSAVVSPIFMASGKLDSSQLDKLSGLLQQAANEQQLVCLMIHHPPLPGMTGWRKGLSNASELQNVLSHHPPALIFHGHLHRNRDQQWHDSRVYCTAAASSISDASYRVIDIGIHDEYWSMQMKLKSVAIDDEGRPGFLCVDTQSWQLDRN